MLHCCQPKIPCLFVFLFAIVVSSCNNHNNFEGWTMAHGNSYGNKYSSLAQIDTSNVQQLQIAWQYSTGDVDTSAHSQIQCNPIVVDGVLYVTSPRLQLFAVDAATGKEKWHYSPIDSTNREHFSINSNRGVAYWTNGKVKRLYYTAGAFLHSIDAKTGKPDTSFGNSGTIDLHDGLQMEKVSALYITSTSAPTVYKNLLLVGTRVSEGMDAAPGDIRAYDVQSGKLTWSFHTIPHPGEKGYETWDDPDAWKYTGGANSWMGITVDQKTGIAYIPTGSAAMDFYGGRRTGANLFANCLLALDAASGKYIWHFQYMHHDTWDYDPSSAPVLVTVNQNGKSIDAVAQTTKTGFVYLFDRATGKSLFPVVETPVDTATGLAGEKLWPTQPIPQRPAPFVRQKFTVNDVNPYLPKDEFEAVKRELTQLNSNGMFTPQSKKGTIILPGFDGGGEWGGPSVDPETGVLYVNANEMAWVLKMYDLDANKNKETLGQAGVRLYRENCMGCHGPERQGGGNYPSIVDAGKRFDPRSFINFINSGRRMMPGFTHLSQQDKDAIAAYVLNLQNRQQETYTPKVSAIDSFRKVPYQISGYNKFLSKSGLPALSPPWGTLNAIDLNNGEHLWKTALGEDPAFSTQAKASGTENYGGAVVTKGGLLFIAATKDGFFRAFNKRNGNLLWQARLPAPGFATPAVYEKDGQEYVVIACGGGKLGTRSGDTYVAFALPTQPK